MDFYGVILNSDWDFWMISWIDNGSVNYNFVERINGDYSIYSGEGGKRNLFWIIIKFNWNEDVNYGNLKLRKMFIMLFLNLF